MRYMALVSVLVLLSFGCGGDGNGDAVTATEPPPADTESSPASAATATPASATAQGVREFAGTAGQSTTPDFRLERGKIVFHLRYDGEGEFDVVLKDSNGNQTAKLAGGSGMRTSGRIDETKTVQLLLPGLYHLRVNADGDWTIDVAQ